MHLYDMRVNTGHCVARFGLPDANGEVKAHSMMVTTLDVSAPHLLFSGSTDRMVKLWDLR